jgi:hypothetical protein
MDPAVTAQYAGLDALRRRRAELFESMAALEQVLAERADGNVAAWAKWVNVALVELAADVNAHVAITEGAGGLHSDVVAKLVDQLASRARNTSTSNDVAELRRGGTALLGRLVKHRQRGADLVFEAYQTDIGGET